MSRKLVIVRGDTATGKSEYVRRMVAKTGGAIAHSLAEVETLLGTVEGVVYLDSDYLSQRVDIELVTMEVRPTAYAHFANGTEFTL